MSSAKVMKEGYILAEIIREVAKNRIPIESLILTGSRARGDSTKQSDYDVVVVMKTILVPLYLKKLREVSKNLTSRFRVIISLHPLPLFTVRKSRGNLFLLKMKKEGKILCGKNTLRLIHDTKPEDILVDWYFSYLISLMKVLIASWNLENLDEIRTNVTTSKKIGRGLLSFSKIIRHDIADTVHEQAITILNKSDSEANSWFYTRNILLSLFKYFVSSFSGKTFNISLNKEIEVFLEMKKGKNILKNFEYATLLILLEKELPLLRGVFSKIFVQDKLRAGVALLLSAIEEDGINENITSRAYTLLRVVMNVEFSNDSKKLWLNLRRAISLYWDCAHTVMGL